MSILKRGILQLSTTFVLVSMMVIGALALHSHTAIAAIMPACSTSIAISGGATGSNSSCNVAVIATGSLEPSGTLSFTADSAIIQLLPIAVGANNFTFGATVIDTRGTSQGWRLQVSSLGLYTTANPTVFLPLSIAVNTSTCIPTVGGPIGSNCPVPAFTPLTLNSIPATLVAETATTGTTPISGTTTLSINGSYNVPVGTAPGAYIGAITLSLLDTSPLT